MAKPEVATVVDRLCLAQMYVARGWCQGIGELSGEVCALESIWTAQDEMGIGWMGDFAAERHLRATLPGRNIVAWNDAPGRTQDEVLDAFSHAIELAEGA